MSFVPEAGLWVSIHCLQDPDPAVLLDADPDPALQNCGVTLSLAKKYGYLMNLTPLSTDNWVSAPFLIKLVF